MTLTLFDRKILPAAGRLLGLLLSTAGVAAAAESGPAEQVIQPELDRRELSIPRIDTEDYEFGLYGGILSVEDLGAEAVYGARLAYHVSEGLFVEGVIGQSTVTDQPLYDLGLPLFPEREQDLTYYAVSVGFNLFPGEVFIGRDNALTSTVYVLAGVGSTSFVDENRFTINFGIGVRMLPVDWLAVHITMRDYLFESDILGTNKITNNFELTAGVSVYF